VLKVLHEMRVPVDYIAGTSMGAIVGGLYASGLSASELERRLSDIDWAAWFSDRPPRADLSHRRKDEDFRYPIPFELGQKWLQLLAFRAQVFLLATICHRDYPVYPPGARNVSD